MDINAIKSLDADMADGVWVDRLDHLGDVRLRVRPMTHPTVVKVSGQTYRAASKGEKLTDDEAEAVERVIMARAMLTGWDNITAKGKPVEFSQQTAEELLKSEVFALAVRNAVARATNQLTATQEALEKN